MPPPTIRLDVLQKSGCDACILRTLVRSGCGAAADLTSEGPEPGSECATRPPHGERGFTLIELLIVVSILAIVGVGVVAMAGGTESDVRARVARAEVDALRDALLRFRTDVGTFPTTGRLALTTDGGSESVPAEGADWFRSPANVVQLLEKPTAADAYSSDTGRGWRGPYIRRDGEGVVDLLDHYQSDGTIAGGSSALLANVPGVADAFETSPLGSEFAWSLASGDDVARHGRPLMMFDLGDADRARIVSFGPNGRYDSAAYDPDDASTWGDDIIVRLLR